MSVDGKIEGSPLYASGINIAGGTHNVIYIATMHNTVYAFDADTGVQLSARGGLGTRSRGAICRRSNPPQFTPNGASPERR
jgi:outer membrane protein assembly factor BamB